MLEQGFDSGELALAFSLGVAEHRGVAPRGGVALDRLRHLGEERVGEIADDHAKDARTPLDQLPRQHVGPVAELIDGGPDTAPRRFRDSGYASYNVGNRRF